MFDKMKGTNIARKATDCSFEITTVIVNGLRVAVGDQLKVADTVLILRQCFASTMFLLTMVSGSSRESREIAWSTSLVMLSDWLHKASGATVSKEHFLQEIGSDFPQYAATFAQELAAENQVLLGLGANAWIAAVSSATALEIEFRMNERFDGAADSVFGTSALDFIFARFGTLVS